MMKDKFNEWRDQLISLENAWDARQFLCTISTIGHVFVDFSRFLSIDVSCDDVCVSDLIHKIISKYVRK